MLENRRKKRELNEPDKESACSVKGNRIVDLEFMSKNMFCSECHERLYIHNIEKETIFGLGSIFHIKCHNCLHISTVKSGEEYVNPSTGNNTFAANTKAILGALHSGIGQTHLNKICTTLDLPPFNPQLFKKHERIIGPIIEYVAKETCEEAVALERVMTEENVETLKQLL